MRILIVEDDRDLSAALAKGLAEEGFAVDRSFDGEDGLFMAREGPHDLVVLDVMLPGCDGFQVLEELRRSGSSVPVIFLTARGEVEDRVHGLRLGGDDFLVKPFSFEELLARIKAVLRRKAGSPRNCLSCGSLVLDIDGRTVSWEGKEILTTPREFAILEALLMSRGKVLSRTDITEHIYDESFDLDSNIIDVHIGNLRRKIVAVAGAPVIETVRGQGFRMSGTVE